jgi:hypothetical protein
VVPYSFFFISIFFLLYGEAEGGSEVVDRIEPLSLSLSMMAAWGDGVAGGHGAHRAWWVTVRRRAMTALSARRRVTAAEAAGDVRQTATWEWAGTDERGGRRQKFLPRSAKEEPWLPATITYECNFAKSSRSL